MREIIIPAHILAETTLDQLYSNTVSSFATDRQQNQARVQVVDKTFIPAPGNRLVRVKATTRSSAKNYETRMAFTEVVYLDDEEDATLNNQAVTFTAPDEQTYMIEPIQYRGTDVRVSCSCLDFYYRFAAWNAGDGSLLGNSPPPYVKKTDSEPVNPNRVPGLCKHLMALTNELRRERIIR